MIKRKFLQREKAAVQKRVWIRLTRCCNNRCIFCLDSENQDGSVIPFKKIEHQLKRGREENIERVVFSGGEPTLHPEFIKIIKKAKDLGYQHIQVITNGRLFMYPDFLKKTVRAGVNEITFSIHGHTKNLHEKQTQIKGSFQQTLLGLNNALKIPGLIVNIDIVVNKINVKYLYEMLCFFINLGVHEFELLQVMPFGRAWENRKKVLYDIKKVYPSLKKVFSLSKNPSLFLWCNRFPPSFLEGFEELIQHPLKLFDEIEGRKEMFEEFLKEEKIMDCFGERCQYCFLENFCKDLIELKKKRFLHSKPLPKCLQGMKINIEKRKLKYKKSLSIYKILYFYLKHRYFVKSLRCEICKYNPVCFGMNIDYIRKKGFKVLKEFKNG